MKLHKTFVVPFDKKSIKTKYIKNGPNSITQSEAPAPEEIFLHKLWADLSLLSGATGEKISGLTGVKISSETPENLIPKKKEI